MIDVWWVFFCAILGATGAVARYIVMTVFPAGRWSWGLFAVNMGGSALVGFAVGVFAVGALEWEPVSLALAFAAGFTTFSTLTVTAAELTERGQFVRGIGVTSVHVVVGAALAALGYNLGGALFGA